jgi:hypothetical protein
MELASQSCDIFAATHIPLPEFLTGSVVSIQPQNGATNTDPAHPSINVS